jgi:hypothetical protein
MGSPPRRAHPTYELRARVVRGSPDPALRPTAGLRARAARTTIVDWLIANSKWRTACIEHVEGAQNSGGNIGRLQPTPTKAHAALPNRPQITIPRKGAEAQRKMFPSPLSAPPAPPRETALMLGR